MTMDIIIRKLGTDPFTDERFKPKEPCGEIDDTGSPFDVLTDEEMHFLTLEAIKRLGKKKAR